MAGIQDLIQIANNPGEILAPGTKGFVQGVQLRQRHEQIKIQRDQQALNVEKEKRALEKHDSDIKMAKFTQINDLLKVAGDTEKSRSLRKVALKRIGSLSPNGELPELSQELIMSDDAHASQLKQASESMSKIANVDSEQAFAFMNSLDEGYRGNITSAQEALRKVISSTKTPISAAQAQFTTPKEQSKELIKAIREEQKLLPPLLKGSKVPESPVNLGVAKESDVPRLNFYLNKLTNLRSNLTEQQRQDALKVKKTDSRFDFIDKQSDIARNLEKEIAPSLTAIKNMDRFRGKPVTKASSNALVGMFQPIVEGRTSVIRKDDMARMGGGTNFVDKVETAVKKFVTTGELLSASLQKEMIAVADELRPVIIERVNGNLSPIRKRAKDRFPNIKERKNVLEQIIPKNLLNFSGTRIDSGGLRKKGKNKAEGILGEDKKLPTLNLRSSFRGVKLMYKRAIGRGDSEASVFKKIEDKFNGKLSEKDKKRLRGK